MESCNNYSVNSTLILKQISIMMSLLFCLFYNQTKCCLHNGQITPIKNKKKGCTIYTHLIEKKNTGQKQEINFLYVVANNKNKT